MADGLTESLIGQLSHVDGLDAGTYAYDRHAGRLELLKRGDFRREAAYLDLGQDTDQIPEYTKLWDDIFFKK